MTVLTTTTDVSYTGNGATIEYTIPFPFLEDVHISVYRGPTGTDADTLLVNGLDYNLYGAMVSSGGKLKLLGGPLASGVKLYITRLVPVIQPTELRGHGIFSAETHEKTFDRIVMMIQKAGGDIARLLALMTEILNSYLSWELVFFYPDRPPNQDVLLDVPVTGPVTFPVGLTASDAHCNFAPGVQTVFDIWRIAGGPTGAQTLIGSITFAIGSRDGVFSLPVETQFASGDIIRIKSNDVDYLFVDLAVNIRAQRRLGELS